MAAPLFDAHCDSLTAPGALRRCESKQLDLERLCAYRPAAQIFAIWARPEAACPEFWHRTAERFLEELSQPGCPARLCRSAQQARRAAADGQIAAFLSAEGAELVGCSMAGLRAAQKRGLRVLTLTWNRSNALAGAAADGGGGLTAAGRIFVPQAQALGVAIDVSHGSERTFWDVLEVARRPVFASHSNARALADHVRNLTDAQFSALIRTGGCAGIALYPPFLGLGQDIPAVLAHMEHFLALGGERAVCLGCDFDGMDGQSARGISGVQDLERLYEAMLCRGWPERLAQDIFYNNLMSFMERAL